jgi:hypothetical protein
MLLIALVALIMASVVWAKWRVEWKVYCRAMVEDHARLARSFRFRSSHCATEVADALAIADRPSSSEKYRRFARSVVKYNRRGVKYNATVADYHVQMSEKWSNATNDLLLSAEPDRHEP